MKTLSILAIEVLFLSIAAFAQQQPAKPANPSAATAGAEPEKRSLTPEQAAKLADIEAQEAQFRLKLGELEQMLSGVIQARKSEVWTAACQAAGWTKQQGECQVDQAGRQIQHNVPKPEPSGK